MLTDEGVRRPVGTLPRMCRHRLRLHMRRKRVVTDGATLDEFVQPPAPGEYDPRCGTINFAARW